MTGERQTVARCNVKTIKLKMFVGWNSEAYSTMKRRKSGAKTDDKANGGIRLAPIPPYICA